MSLFKDNLSILKICIFAYFISLWCSLLYGEDDYNLGPGDVLEVIVPQDKTLTRRRIKIGRKGEILLGYVGNINLNNLTLNEAQKKIKNHIEKDYLKHVNVSIDILFFGSKKVTIYGEVRSVGEVALRKNTALVSDVIALAKGKVRDTSGMAYVIRNFNKKSPFEIIKNYEMGNIEKRQDYQFFNVEQSKGFKILPGDFIYIPPVFQITVVGEASSPGIYKFKFRPNIVTVMAAARGFKKAANKEKIKIKREGKKETKNIIINYNDYVGDNNKTYYLLNNDVVIVPESWL